MNLAIEKTMAAQNPNQVLSVEVLEFEKSSQLIQAMEARGDFKYRGIQNLFEEIADWTTRFSVNKILPTLQQLEAKMELPADKVEEFLVELLGRGSTTDKYVVSFPAIEVDPRADNKLNTMVVFCRPMKGDGDNAGKYVNAYNEKSYEALCKWIARRVPPKGSDYTNFLIERINAGKLRETQAGSEITSFFKNPFDTTLEHRKFTYNITARILIQRLIQEKKLLLLNPNESSLAPNYRVICYNDIEGLETRFKIIAGYFLKNIKIGQLEMKEAVDYEKMAKLASSVTKAEFNNLPLGAKQVVLEIILLAPRLTNLKKEQAKKQLEETLNEHLAHIKKMGRMIDIDTLKSLTPDIRSKILSSSEILSANYPVKRKIADFILHVANSSNALMKARMLYDKNGDETEIRILKEMEVEKNLSDDEKKAFQELLHRIYFERLSLFKRILRALFGKSKLKPEEVKAIENMMEKETAAQKVRIQKIKAKQKQKEIVSAKMKESEERESGERPGKADKQKNSSKPQTRELDEKEKAQMYASDEEAKQLLNKIIKVLDDAWDAGELPNRTTILNHISEFNENNLIAFLKKHARKEIYSFRVRNEKPEYVWPILISRHYIRKNGRKMLQKAIKESDEQRRAAMPNQEKFDVSTAIEDFLTKLMQKTGR